MKKNSAVQYTVMAALFAAATAVTTAYVSHIPVGVNGGYIHVGDMFIYIAACFLPAPYAMASAAIGAGIADLLTAPMWIFPTVIIKSLLVLPFSNKSEKILVKRNYWALITAALISCGGYYFAEAVIFGNWIAPFASIFASVLQSVASAVLFILVSAALDKSDVKKKLSKMI
jgi:uncharacterized repeat protein (TIGR04002 family)